MTAKRGGEEHGHVNFRITAAGGKRKQVSHREIKLLL